MQLQPWIRKTLKEHGLALVVLLIGAGTQLFLVAQPITFLLGNVLPDDAFYYFEIARNLALGHGSTFDGITPTNGYHPLWMFLLSALYSVSSTLGWGAVEPIRVALVLCIGMNIVTGAVVYAMVRRVSAHTFISTFALGVFVLNPFLLYELINGLETSLALMLTSIFVFYAWSIQNSIRERSFVTLGVLGGLMILARLDLIFLVGGVGLYFLVKDWEKKDLSFKKTLLIAVPVTALIVPFFIWNYFTYGTFLTSASGANELVNHALIIQDNGTGLYQSVKAVIYNLHGQLRDLMIHTGAPEVTLLFIGAFLMLIALGRIRVPQSLRSSTVLHGFYLGFALLFILNVAVRFTARTWYFVSFGIVFALLVAYVLREVAKENALTSLQRTVCAVVLAVFTFSSFFIWWHKELRESMGLQREMYAAAQWFNEHVPKETIIGVFNAGVQGYFTDARVVNLDGLVNNDAYEAMKSQTLWKYMQSAHIEYLSDFDIYIDYRYRSFYGVESLRPYLKHVTNLELVKSNKSDHGISIYKIHP